MNPNNEAILYAYYDALQEVRVYTGWKYTSGSGGYTNLANYSQDTTSNRPAVAVSFDNLAFTTGSGSSTVGKLYSESFTMTQVARVASGTGSTVYTENGASIPMGAEAIANVQSLSLAIQNQAEQIVETREFYDLPSHSGSISGSGAASVLTAIGAGSAWTSAYPLATANYYKSAFAYDNKGLLNKTVNANGTIRRYVHDSLGRTTSVWIGGGGWGSSPDDHVSSGYWGSDNPGSMSELEAFVYDNNGIGDSLLTMTVQFPVGMASAADTLRMTETAYNWLEQPVNVKQGVLVAEYSSSSGAIAIAGLSEQSGGSALWLVRNPSGEGTGGDTTQRPIIHAIFDLLGNVVEQDNHGSETDGTASVPRVVLNATFDANGNRTALNAAIGSGSGTADFQDTFGFDYLNRETSIVQQGASGGHTVGYKKAVLGYDADSRLTGIDDYRNSTDDLMTGGFYYDHAGRTTGVSWHDNVGRSSYGGTVYGADESASWENLGYSYDDDSRVTSYTNYSYEDDNGTYTYDHTHQLTEEDIQLGGYGGPIASHLFDWDANGNPTGTSSSGPDGYGGTYYSSEDGFLTGDGNRLLCDGRYDYQYDPAGHLVKRLGLASGANAETDYTWDNRDRLVEVKNRGSVGGSVTLDISYVYDMFDRLISRTQGSTTTRFVYDGKRMVLAFNSSGGITDRFLWGPAVDQILADEHYSTPSTSAAGLTYWTTFDKQGSVRDLITATSSAASLANHIAYDSFGAVTSGGNPTLFLHEGVFTDPSTGMEWHSDPSSGFPGRWYDPASRRWISEDPTGLGADSNPYRSDDNSPTNETDPGGLQGSSTRGNPYKPGTFEWDAWNLSHPKWANGNQIPVSGGRGIVSGQPTTIVIPRFLPSLQDLFDIIPFSGVYVYVGLGTAPSFCKGAGGEIGVGFYLGDDGFGVGLEGYAYGPVKGPYGGVGGWTTFDSYGYGPVGGYGPIEVFYDVKNEQTFIGGSANVYGPVVVGAGVSVNGNPFKLIPMPAVPMPQPLPLLHPSIQGYDPTTGIPIDK